MRASTSVDEPTDEQHCPERSRSAHAEQGDRHECRHATERAEEGEQTGEVVGTGAHTVAQRIETREPTADDDRGRRIDADRRRTVETGHLVGEGPRRMFGSCETAPGEGCRRHGHDADHPTDDRPSDAGADHPTTGEECRGTDDRGGDGESSGDARGAMKDDPESFRQLHDTSLPAVRWHSRRDRCDTDTVFWCLSPRDVVVVTGHDAASYLQSQLSQDIAGLGVGHSAWSFLLAPNGRIDALVRVWYRDPSSFVLDTDAGFGATMVARLNRFRIRVDVTIEAVEVRVVAVRGVTDRPNGSVVAWGEGYDIIGSEAVAPDGITEGSATDLLTARIAACWPAMGAEIVSGETIPAETGVVPFAVNFTKGCYPGQELVERMDSRGAVPPRSLVAVDVVAGARPGDPYLVDGEAVGVLTSVAGTRALAIVRRTSAG